MSDRSDPGVGPGTTDKRALLAELLRERAARPQQFPLSFSQQRLWFLGQLGDGGGAYHITAAWRARGPLDPAVLDASLREVVRRQKSLRTTFATADGEPVQVIAPRPGAMLPGIDLTALPAAAARAEAQRIATLLVYRRFDLERGPLLRVALLHLGPAESVIALAMHHIIADGWSIGVLIRDLATVYAAFAAGRPSPLPKLPVQYVDFVQWQRSWLRGDVLEAQLSYWKERLGPGGGVLELPTDRPRPAVQSFRGAGQPVALSPGLREGLIRLGQREGATLFMVLLAAFKVLLHRYTGQDQVTAGSPIAYRNRRELEEVIGFFSNTLVVRTDLSGQPTFLELLARVRAGALGDLSHQDVPFEKLVEVLQPERDLSRTPLFQVAFALQNTPASAIELPGLDLVLAPLEIERRSAKFDLTVELTEGPYGIAGTFDYNRDLFDRSRILRAVGHFEVLLTGLLADPGRRVTELPLLSTAEEAQVILEWSDTDRECPQRPLVHELFDLHAERRPDAPAVSSREAVLTYGELRRRANRLAHHLQALGVGPDVLVAVCTDRTIDRVVGIAGVLKAGGAYVSIDPKHPRDRLAFLLEDARAPVLLTERRFLEVLPETAATVLCLDTGRGSVAGRGDLPPRTGVTPDHLSYVVYTSGSTGRPKGVEIPHAGLMNLVRWHSDLYEVRPGDHGTQVASPAFDASIWELWPYLASGASLHIPDEETRLSSAGMIRWWDEEGITLAYLMTPLAEGVLEEKIPPGTDLRVRALIIGGDRLHRGPDPEVGFRLMNHYGPAEYTVTCTVVQVPPRGEERGLPTIGRAIDNTSIYLLDRHLQPVPAGIPGELYVAGIGLARGYLRRPDLTAEKFVPDPFAAARGEAGARMYRTADLVRWLPDGDMDFLGRLDHQVKVRGLRIELGEIETVLGQHPGIRETAVLVREDRPGDKRLVAYAVAARELPPAVEDLRAFLREHLPEYMVPAAFVFLAALPLTPNGKVDRRALPAPEAEPEAFAAPRTPAEELVAQIFAELLQAERVGLQGHFFELGGHSLLATRVVSRLREAAGVELPLRALFDAPTVGALAGLVERGLRTPAPLPALVPAPRDQPLPLSFAQQRLWWLDRLEPGSATYHVPAAVRLRGPLRPAALAAALGEVVRRHEVLRTAFASRDGGDPVQVIAPAAPFPLPALDLSALPAARAREELLRLAREEARRPFDLDKGPLLRLSLALLGEEEQGEEEQAALMTLHHIVSDAWSVGLLVGELAALYGAALAGRPAPLPELRVQYADFAVWQRGWLAGERLAAELAYWRERLEGAPPALELPTDRPRPAVRSSAGARLPLSLPSPWPEDLRRLGLARQTTLFMALLAAFSALLARYTGQDDVSVGTPIAGRNHLGTEALIGCFVNTLVLRTRLAPRGSFADLLRGVRETTLAAYSHQDLPFEKLVEELQPERNLSITPLFQVLLVLQNAPAAPAGFPGLAAEFLDVDSGAAKFDLTLSWLEADGALHGSLEYRPDLFDRATLQRLAGHFESLLRHALAAPEQPLEDLPLLAAPELHQIVEWNATGESLRQDLLLHEWIGLRAEAVPDAVAVVCGGVWVSYRELRARARRLARRLTDLGVGPDMPVAICAERSPELICGLLAILEAGGAYVPLDPSYPGERLAFMLGDALAGAPHPVLLIQERLLPLVASGGPAVVLLDAGPDGDAELPAPRGPASPDSLAYVIYTSGSTGRPKGAMNTHRAICNRLLWMQGAFGLDGSDRVLQKTPLSFDVSVWELFWPLMTGACMVLARPGGHKDGAYLVRLIEEEGITTLHFVPSMLQVFLEEPDLERCRPLRRVIASGEALPRELANRCAERLGAELHNLYGPTEAAVDVTARRCERRGEGALPIGRPIANLEIHLLDAAGRPVPVGVHGELHIGGVGLARGYLARPGLTAEKFVPHGGAARSGERLYRTGDLARWLPDGEIDYLGRIDHQVKVRGFRIEPGEIESVLGQHPGVREAVVLARRGLPGEVRLAAYVVPREGSLPEGELRRHLGHRLPEHMVPAFFVALDALPLLPNGKVDRRALPAPEQPAAAAHVSPRTPMEEALAGIFAEVLRLDRVGVTDGFFDRGGHSLLAIRVLSRIRSAFGVELPVRRLFERPTVASLAEEVGLALRAGGRARPPVTPAPRDRPLPLSFAQERLWFLDRLEPGSAAYNISAATLLAGRLDPGALAAALAEVVRRHEALRTVFTLTPAGEPVQEVRESPSRPLPRVDLCGLPATERERERGRLLREEALRPFDLARGPLMRTLLVATGGSEHALLLVLHHIVSDAWSMGILVRETVLLYEALSQRRPSPLPELAVQYPDFAVWQRRWLGGEALDAELAHWRRRLGPVPAVLELPADRARSAGAYRGGRVTCRLAGGLPEGIEALARARSATPFMVLLAAFQTLLARYTEQEDVAVGAPVAGRGRLELEGLIGFFVNTLVLRSDLSGDPRFLALLDRVRETTLEAYAHQDVPFARLVEELQPARDLSHPPLFQVMLNLLNVEGPRLDGLRLPELDIQPLILGEAPAKLDLSLFVLPAAGGLELRWIYDAGRFDAPRIVRMARHFESLLRAAVAAPGLPLSGLPLLAAEEAQQVLREWNDTAPADAAGPPVCLQDLFAAQARRRPEAVALVQGETAVTYGELRRRAARLAAHLAGLGVGPEVRVALCLERSPEMVEALLAVLAAGGAYVPLDPGLPPHRLAHLLEDSGAALVLTREGERPRLPGFRGPAAGTADPDHLAYVVYTSGSTGRPKGVLSTHRGAVSYLGYVVSTYGLGPGDRVLQLPALTFDSSVRDLLGPLSAGATVVLLEPGQAGDPAAILASLARCDVTRVLSIVPSLLRALLGAAREGEYPVASLRTLLVSGERLYLEDCRQVWSLLGDGVEIANQYGPTECVMTSGFHRVARDGEREALPAGRPIPGRRFHVLDRSFAPVPPGVPGALLIGGPGLARGYLGRPDLTAEAFVPDPFAAEPGGRLYVTGDRVRHLPGGALEFLGRRDLQIKIQGQRVEPGEVEAALRRCPGIRAAAVTAREDLGPGLRLAAYLEVESAPGPADGELRRQLRDALPEAMIPAVFVRLPVLPLTPNGKVDRRALPAPAPVPAAGALPSRGPVEELLATIWCAVLGVESAGPDDDFFALGGHSLLATRVMSRIREAFGVELPLRHLFEHPTVASLAGQVESALAAGRRPAPAIERLPRDAHPPLSFAQQRLWFLDRLEPGSPAYNIPLAFRLLGRLDVPALAAGLGEIVRRHETLRTVFRISAGDAVQVIGDGGPAHLPVVDLTGLPPAQRPEEARRLALHEARQPFDLERGPLLRHGLVVLNPGEHLALLTLHHIVGDAWSVGILVHELGTLYGAFTRSLPSPLPELAIQYADHARWQRRWLAGDVLAAQLAYWREELRGLPAALELPTDRPRPAAQTFRGERHRFALPAELPHALRALCRRQGTTLFMALMAAFQSLLGRYSGQDDVAVGTPIAGRTDTRTEPLIGLFVNMLVVRGRLAGEPAFAAHLDRARETMLRAYAHQDLPFERLIEELQIPRDLSRTPLFQAVLALQNTPDAPLPALPGLTLVPEAIHTSTAKFDLIVSLIETGGALRGFVEYNLDLFDRSTVQRLLSHLATLLAAAASAPETRLPDLPLLAPAERAQMVLEWNDTAAGYGRHRLLHELFLAQAALRPEAAAVVARDERLSYGELAARSHRLARHLRALGVGRGDRVGLLLDRSAAMIPALLGVLAAGAAYVPLETRLPEARLRWILQAMEVRVLLASGSRLATVASLLPELPLLRHVVCMDRLEGPAPALPAGRGLWTREDLEQQPGGALERPGDAEDLAYVIFTSGSTGTPKGVMVRHRPVVNLVEWVLRTFSFGPDDRVLFVTSLSFDLSVFDIFGLLAAGGSIRVASDDEVGDPGALARALATEPITFWDSAPAALQQLVPFLAPAAAARGRRALRLAFLSGDWVPLALPGEVQASFPEARIVALGGATEATVWSNFHRVEEIRPHWRSVPYGRPIQNARYYVLDGALEPCPIGVPGDLYIGGECLSSGYAGEPALTARKYLPDPGAAEPGAVMYHTGDRARFWADGTLEFLGRLDHQVKVRGFRIELGEIEAVLGQHEAVAKAVALVREDRPGDRRIVAYVVPGTATPPSGDELRALLRARLPEYMVPAALVFLDGLPLTANGKVDRGALPAPETGPAGAEAGGIAPRNPVEELLAGIWSDLLPVERIGVADDFFELGGHSLLATRMIARVRDLLGVELSLRGLFEAPTLEETAVEVERRRRSGEAVRLPPIVPVPRRGPLPLSFAQQRLWFLDRLEPESAAYNVPAAVLLRGPLSVPLAAAALDEVVRRHEVLRTTFEVRDGEPVQSASAASAAGLGVVDLSALPPPLRLPRARRIAQEEAGRPFDLARGPLLRALVVELSTAEHALLVTMHHIVSDAWSVAILVRELGTLYGSWAAGRPSPLPELAVQYADFASWQRRHLAGELLRTEIEYWRHQLAGLPPRLELPLCRPRPAVPTGAGSSVRTEIPQEVLAPLRTLSRRQGATLFMTLLTAFYALLHRYTGQTDIAVGSPVAGRNHVQTESLIGFFINTLVLRADLSGRPAFSGLLGRVRGLSLDAYTHQELPFEKLVEELQPDRSLGHTPLFQVFFELQNAPGGAVEMPGLALEPLGLETTTAKFDVTLSLTEGAGSLYARLEHSAELFDAPLMERWLRHFRTILAAAAGDPGCDLAGLPLLAAEERQQALLEWNDRRAAFPLEAGVPQLLEEQARRRPDAVAAVCGADRLTYRQLDARARRAARRLAARGVGPETLVALLAERGLDLLTAILAVFEAGAAYLPLDPRNPGQRQLQILRQSGARLVLATHGLGEALARGLEETAAPERPEVLPLEALLDEGGEECDPPAPFSPAHLAYTIYTSGSTGVPKGAMVEQRGLLNHLWAKVADLGLTAESAVLQNASQCFDISVWQHLAALAVGGRVCIAGDEAAHDPERLLALVRSAGITVLEVVPSMLRSLLDAAEGSPGLLDLPRLEWLVVTGEAFPADLCRRWLRLCPGTALVNAYGPTECADDITHHVVRRAPPAAAVQVPIGRPVANFRLYVVDRAWNPVPPGAAGELCAGGEGVGRGYLGDPVRTAQAFVPDPLGGEPGARLYRTGDLARHAPDGALEFLGRIDHQVKVRGFRIELGEIEARLAEHPEVRRSLVLVREDTPGDARITAYVVPAEGRRPQARQLRTFLGERLADYMVPSSFVLLDEIPLLPNGKVDRRRLPAPDAARDQGVRPPRTEAGRAVAAVWRDALGVESVGIEDNFFDLGGHSLLMIRVQTGLRKAGFEVSLTELFQYPTVKALAGHLGQEETPAAEIRPSIAPPEGAVGRGTAIAVVAMAGRFPGARDVAELWRNLRDGVESITFFTDEELAAAGVRPELLRDPRYVKARGVLDGLDLFDAAFFGVPPREAQLMDPQQRLFLECAWETLEAGGYDPGRYPGRIGVYAGAGANSYLLNLLSNPDLIRSVDGWQISLGNRNDFLPLRVSYKLGLKGPSINVQTACSTSLVAIAIACEHLAAGRCDMALAGGVSVAPQPRSGYLYEEGGIASPDGHTRAFDAASRGTVSGSGVGAVLLKRLEDALADGDSIRAVIRGVAVNNDGAVKVGFTAPSVEGQEEVIAAAHAAAGVDPSSITYVEAHGTGTPLGDPVEVAALARAFRARTGRTGFCALGSIKTNLGHLDAAAGVAGLIKAVLALEERQIPPSLHFRTPNPEIDFAGSPFRVSTSLTDWMPQDLPRRAGVSSFGMGGTNAHAVLEEAPAPRPGGLSRPWHLLLLSARTPAALEAAGDNLARHLAAHPEQDLSDVAYTLQLGRRAFPLRRIVVCPDRETAVAALTARSDSRELVTGDGEARAQRSVVFLLPGQGAQHAAMAAELYAEEPVFRHWLDAAAGHLSRRGVDLLQVLLPVPGGEEEAARRLAETEITQPALFAVEHALARLWMAWGARPSALLGHSLGEYVAACLAGVFTLEEGLDLVAARGRLMQALPPGGMLAVPLPEEEVLPLLGTGLSLAAVNGPASCVVSGPLPAVAALEADLAARGLEARRLRTSHAFHSALVEPVLDAFAAEVGKVRLREPEIPYISNLTGAWITPEQATDPASWAAHLRHTVRFGAGLAEVLALPGAVLLEVGPGETLSALARRHPERRAGQPVVPSLPRPGDSRPDLQVLLGAAGRLWLAGVEIDWAAFQQTQGHRRRVPLPTYPFERQRHWVEAGAAPPPAPRDGEVRPEPEPPPGAGTGQGGARGDRAAPRTALEQALARIWQDLLGVESVGLHDDFFELGGSSLMAVRLAARLRQELGAELPPDLLMAAPTVARMAAAFGPASPTAAEEAVRRPSCLTEIQPGDGSRPPLFLVHPIGGFAYIYRNLVRELGPEQPAYGLRALGFGEGEEVLGSFEEMAARYIEELRERQPRGPYHLGGSSLGGLIAYEMAQQLRAQGQDVALLALLDTPGPSQMPVRPQDEAEMLVDLLGNALPLSVEDLRGMSSGERLLHLVEVARAQGGISEDFGLEDARRHLTVVEALWKAMFDYRPQPYPGRIFFVRAEERGPTDPIYPELAWIGLAREGTEVHVVPGGHTSMHYPPYVEELGYRLRTALHREKRP